MSVRKVDGPLRRDVRMLGEVLGEVLRRHARPGLFDLEEQVRALAIRRRRGERKDRPEATLSLEASLSGLEEELAEPLIRSFSLYFQLVNLAEQHHRVRRARAHATDAAPQRGSVAATLLEAKRRGVTAQQAREALRSLHITLTFTAHPSQALRRTVLEKVYRISRVLEDRDRCAQTPAETVQALAALREEVSGLWLTDELRRERPSVGDEVKTILWYIEEVLWPLLPRVTSALDHAFQRAYGELLGPCPPLLRFHSWVGGDMDGNPLVTPDVLEDAMRAYREHGLKLMLSGLEELGSVLSHSSRHVKVPQALLSSLEEEAKRLPEIAQRQGPRTEGEPWRRKLRFMEARISRALDHVEAQRSAAREQKPQPPLPPPGAVYSAPSELVADLDLLGNTLMEATGAAVGSRRVEALREQVASLGFQVAELELRVPAEDARAAVEGTASEGAARLTESLKRVAGAQRDAGESACRTLILSMTTSARDVLAALECCKRAGVWDEATGSARMDVVPLLETHGALVGGEALLRELLETPAYRAHLAVRGAQEVMGYSDSGKEVGLLAASNALYRAQSQMAKLSAQHGVPLRFFHGRGETVARGGGPAQQGILALPPGTVGGRYKATEQGEALDHKYARPELALRTLELVIGGALLHTLDAQPQPSSEEEQQFLHVFDELGELGRKAYRALVWEDERFEPFFRAVTPIEEISQLNIGSRPAKRSAGGMESLRAIPWVFAWTQNRAILPGWYGVGTALQSYAAAAPENAAKVHQLYERWPYFRAVIDNVEMVLAKSDLDIAGRYVSLAPKETRKLWARIQLENSRTRRWVKRVTEHRRIADGNPPLQRSIALRNPYVDPLSLLQVDLLRRKRAGELSGDRLLLLTLAGISGGMRNTG